MSNSDSKPATLEEAAAVIVKKLLAEKWEIVEHKKEDPDTTGSRFVSFVVIGADKDAFKTCFVFCEDESGTPFLETIKRDMGFGRFGFPSYTSNIWEDRVHAKITPEDFAALRKKHDEIVERKAAARREYNLKMLEKYTVED